MTDEQIEKLKPLGVSEQADLAFLEVTDLEKIGVPTIRARRIIGETKQAGQQHAAVPTAGGEEEVKSVITAKAPPGTTAVLKLLRRSGDLARQLGLPDSKYWGCSHCRNDVGAYAEDEGLRVDQFKQCPFCDAVIVTEQKVHCYSCDQQLTAGGQCVNCGGSVKDDFALKAMTLYVRRNQGSSGRLARSTAQGLLQDASFKAQVVAQARAEKWIEKVEEGPIGSMPPFGINPTSVGGGNIYAPPVDLPGQVSLPTMPAFGRLALQHLKRHELEAIIEEGGHNTGSLPYNTDLQTFAREAIHHFSRRSQVGNLLRAAYKLHPEVDWAVELGLVPSDAPRMQKAGFGDTIFGSKYAMTGDFRGANIRIGDDE